MKFIFTLTLAVLAATASVAPAFAAYHCYVMNGRTICCNAIGSYTYCN